MRRRHIYGVKCPASTCHRLCSEKTISASVSTKMEPNFATAKYIAWNRCGFSAQSAEQIHFNTLKPFTIKSPVNKDTKLSDFKVKKVKLLFKEQSKKPPLC